MVSLSHQNNKTIDEEHYRKEEQLVWGISVAICAIGEGMGGYRGSWKALGKR